MSNDFNVEVKPRLVLASMIMRLGWLVGRKRANRWAWRWAMWRSRYRVDGGRWRRLSS